MKKNIIATLGPSSLKKKIIEKMDLSGVDLFRINLSHTKLSKIEETIIKIQKWTNKPVCVDTEGAQLRTGYLGKNRKKVKTHEMIKFAGHKINQSSDCVPLSIKGIENLLYPGDLIKIDFDTVIVQITSVKKNYITGRVISGGIIDSNKGISIDRQIDLPSFTQKDIDAFSIAKKLGLKTVFLSFCSKAENVKKLRNYFDYEINVISKIESKSGIENIIEICKESDGILIDRGDLSRDVPIEKIAYAQRYILNKAKVYKTPVYIATNLMESMIENSKPTRAEINDIVSALEAGSAGLVLAAESAIGKYPVDCVRIMSRIIHEVEKFNLKKNNRSTDYLFSLPSDRITSPHGGKLIQQYISGFNNNELSRLIEIEVDDKCESDIFRICEGTYSPVESFMNYDNLISVLDNYKLSNGIIWPMPILFQLEKNKISRLPSNGKIALKSKASGKFIAILYIESIQKLHALNEIAIKWFGTDDINHPGVYQLFNSGEYIISGKPYVIEENKHANLHKFELSPRQTRDIFNQNGWHNVIGFHTRNICHNGHEYIQNQALKLTNADAIFISPVTGKKKKGDFTSEIVLLCYEELIKTGAYNPYGVLLGSFNTYSRFSGPREAVFTAICRKNYGCNHFIIGRDHTGIGNYYKSDSAQKIFDKLDIDMNIIKFNTAYYSNVGKKITNNLRTEKEKKTTLPISATIIRDSLKNNQNIPAYLMDKGIINIITNKYQIDPHSVLEK
jgi:pyruvate kinase